MASEKKCKWVEAKDADEKKAAVIADPSVRHVYAQALTIYHELSDAERTQADKNEADAASSAQKISVTQS